MLYPRRDLYECFDAQWQRQAQRLYLHCPRGDRPYAGGGGRLVRNIPAGPAPIRDCIGCGQCTEHGCIFTDDAVNAFIEKARHADGFVFGTPVYYAHPSGRVLSFLDRVFYSAGHVFAYKPGAAVASARRAGTTASLDALQKYFGISQMPTIGSTYWNMVHGNRPEEVALDAEGLQTMRNIGHNLAWMLKCLQAGKEAGLSLPKTERGSRTNFIRP